MTPLADDLQGLSTRLGELVVGLEPDLLPLPEVTDVWAAFVELERLAAAGKILVARRVSESGQWSRAGFAHPEDFIADRAGTSTGRARSELDTSKRLADLDQTADALRRGELSSEQADAISDAALVNPSAEADLLDHAKKNSVKDLKDQCGRKKAAGDPDPEATRRRIHANRRARTWKDNEGGWNFAARGTVDAGAEFHHVWDRLIDQRFEAGRQAGSRELRAAYAFDALIDLARGAANQSGGDLTTVSQPQDGAHQDGAHQDGDAASGPTRSSSTNPKHLALIRVDLAALIRGRVEHDELCEITGLGPLPVRVIRDLLGDSIMKLVITRGSDVANVTHLGRGVNVAQQVALLWSDPTCRVEGCHRTRLENDHREDWARTHHTRLDEIDPLCGHHHGLKTTVGWAMVSGSGRRPFVPPEDPRHPRFDPGRPIDPGRPGSRSDQNRSARPAPGAAVQLSDRVKNARRAEGLGPCTQSAAPELAVLSGESRFAPGSQWRPPPGRR